MSDRGWGNCCPVGTLCIDRDTNMPCVTVEHTGDHHYRVMLLDGRFRHRYGAGLIPVKQKNARPAQEDRDTKHRAIAEAVFDVNDLDNLEPCVRKRRAPAIV